ncbi:unnamed protein product [Rotaria sp. Silwood1]|nr:unnamed protein product [Rotaria sp. Silwood1]
MESPVIRELKILLFENMNKRFPVLPLNICGFLLDPSQLKLDINCDDVLQFWRLSADNFPHLKVLAQIVLAIPVTSTPSEQIFSTTGLILNAKRTMLSPENVGKIQMIHDNYNIFKPT